MKVVYFKETNETHIINSIDDNAGGLIVERVVLKGLHKFITKQTDNSLTRQEV